MDGSYSGYLLEQCLSPEKGRDGGFESGEAALETPSYSLFSNVQGNYEAGPRLRWMLIE